MLQIQCKRVGRSENYVLIFPYDAELISKIKELSSELRDFDAPTKLWIVNAKGISGLIKKYKGRTHEIKFEFEDDKQRKQFINILNKHANKAEKDKIKLENLEKRNAEILEIKKKLPELSKTINYKKYLKDNFIPMPHQLEGAYFMDFVKSGIIAFEMGLGKTALALLAALMDENLKQVLIICPSNLKINWLMEIMNFTHSTGYIIKLNPKGNLTKYRRNGGRELQDCKFIITNYEYFSGAKFDFEKKITNIGVKPDLIICDESHRLSNKKAQSTDNILTNFEDVERKFLLSGTPVRNKLESLFFALKMVKPEEFSNKSTYLEEYCGLTYDKDRGWIPDDTKQPKLKELNKKLQTFMFRLKKNVLVGLPELYMNKLYLEMTPEEEKEYKEVEDGFAKVDWNSHKIISTTDEDNNSPIVILGRLRQITSKVKMRYVKELIEELNDLGEKTLLFDVFKKPLHVLKEQLGDNTAVYDGDLTADKKQDLVDAFQDANSKLMNMLISINAGSTGITLTKANRVFLISQDYLVSTNEQAFSRSHRKGQTRDVYGTVLILADTIDEIIDNALTEKKKTINAVVDGEDYKDISTVSVFGDVINELKSRYSV